MSELMDLNIAHIKVADPKKIKEYEREITERPLPTTPDKLPPLESPTTAPQEPVK